MHEEILDQIYEAALIPDMWPSVLDTISGISGSVGGALLTTGGVHPPRWVASATVAPALNAFAQGNAWKSNKRPERWLSANHAGFLRDVDLFTADELNGDPMLPELTTHGLGWQLGSCVPMTSGEVVVFSLERRHSDGPHDIGMRDAVDPLRPHLARAGLLAARLGLERARTAVATLEALGLPAAVTTGSGRVLVSNELFGKRDVVLPAAHGAVLLSDTDANALLQDALSIVGIRSAWSRSIPVRGTEERPPSILHVMPLPGNAQDIFSGAAILLILTELSNEHRPDLTLLHGLFDLSPAEAKLAAALSAGRTLKNAAAEQNIRESTARSYLEVIFRKTGVRQQSQLVALLARAGKPRP
jgi:DNA-binding CsgD family transcriptional regulator